MVEIQCWAGDGVPWPADVWEGLNLLKDRLSAQVPITEMNDARTILEDWQSEILREIVRYQEVESFTKSAISELHTAGDQPLSALHIASKERRAEWILSLYVAVERELKQGKSVDLEKMDLRLR